MTLKSRLASDHAIGFLSPIGLLLLWEIAGRTGLIDVRFFPLPSAIVLRLYTLMVSGELLRHLCASVQRLIFGFVVGGVPALFLGVAMGLSRPIRSAINPLISATYPIPKSAVFPLLLLIFGLGEASKIAMVALGIFYPLLINTIAGVANIPRVFLDVGHNFGADRWQMFRTVAIPGALPSIMAGIKLGVGMGLILIVIAELTGADSGIGYMIWDAWQVLNVETMYVGLAVIAVLGFVMTMSLDAIERRLLPWQAN
jgi:ABC-type nitrate/sulfonate/bicarbonate transport system permease component